MIPEIRRGNATWDEFFTRQGGVWENYNRSKATLIEEYQAIAMMAPGSGTLPKLSPATRLNADHVGQVFGSTPNDLVAGLTQMSTIMPKDTWRALVRGKVRGLAGRAGTPTDPDGLGFTVQALDEVYDSLIRSMGVDPSRLHSLQPTKMMLEGLAGDIHTIRSTRGMSGEAYDQYNRVLDRVEAGAATLPIHQEGWTREIGTGIELDLGPGEAGTFRMFPEPEPLDPAVERLMRSATDPDVDDTALREALRRGESYTFQDGTEVAPLGDTGQYTVLGDYPGEDTIMDSIDEVVTRVENLGLLGTPNSQSIQMRRALSGEIDPDEANRLVDVDAAVKEKVPQDSSYSSPFSEMSVEELTKYRDRLSEEIISLGDDITPEMNELRRTQAWLDARTGKKSTFSDALYDVLRDERGSLTLPGFGIRRRTEQVSWQGLRARANERARVLYDQTFTNYDEGNVFDAAMKSIFPFWTYEAQRWPYLWRLAAQKPGMFNSWRVFEGNTDQDPRNKGYVNMGFIPDIPTPLGTASFRDLSINPTRGTIFMGGMFGMMRKWPEYYDNSSSRVMGGFLNQIGRYGFFPGLWGQIPAGIAGVSEPGLMLGPISTGLQIPPVISSPLNAAVSLGIPGASTIRSQVFPNEFQEYNTIQVASKYAQEEGLEVSGADIYLKVQGGLELTKEEQGVWNRAQRKSASYQVLFEQTGVFKLTVEERAIANKASQEFIYSVTGITPDQQNELYRNGKRVQDVVALPPHIQEQLYNMEHFQYWTGLNAPLEPESFQRMNALVAEFWDENQRIQERSLTEGFTDQNILSKQELERRWLEGSLSSVDYLSQLQRNKAYTSAQRDVLKQTNRFKDVPISLDERMAWAEETGKPPPTQHPMEEIITLYYEIQPELKADGSIDWLGYYSLVDGLIDHLPEPYKGEFLEWIHRNWTDTERLWWKVNREYVRPYNNVREGVIQSYPPEAQTLLRNYSRLDQSELDAMDEPTQALIRDFTTTLTQARQNFRSMVPELDAWLYFWGDITTLRSDEAERIFQSLQRQYRKGGGSNPLGVSQP
jgi:hypothetical protein